MSVFNRWPFKTSGFCLAVIHIKIVTPTQAATSSPPRDGTPSPPRDGYTVTPPKRGSIGAA